MTINDYAHAVSTPIHTTMNSQCNALCNTISEMISMVYQMHQMSDIFVSNVQKCTRFTKIISS